MELLKCGIRNAKFGTTTDARRSHWGRFLPFRNPQSAIRNLLLLSSLLILPACSHTNTTSDSVYKDSAPAAKATAADQHWIPLFNGHDTTGWHLYHAQGQPVTNWQAQGGTLKCVTKGHDLISDASYSNFILDLDYKLEPHVNSGIVYRCDESEAKAWQTGVEYQLIDNETKDPLEAHMNAAAYALYGCTTDANHPAGQWNHARIVCDGTHVTHYLNGTKVVEYDTDEATGRPILPKGYKPSPDEEYMNALQQEYFRQRLQQWRNDLVEESKQTIENLREEVRDIGDEAERATRETENSLELRTRDRYRKLIGKIDSTLKRVESGEYGYSVDSGEEIGLERLEARLTAERTIDEQERWEHLQKQIGD